MTAGLLYAPSSSAALISKLNGTVVYDTDFNITWLADANYAKTSGFDSDGLMPWSVAMTWANNLVYAGYDDWRLPTTLQPDASCSTQNLGNSYDINCTGSEMGHLFYTGLGGTANQSILTTHNANFNFFTNIQPTLWYMSATDFAPQPTFSEWLFKMSNGEQTWSAKSATYFAWPVRTGDVGPSGIPEPGILSLLLSGCLGWFAAKARRR